MCWCCLLGAQELARRLSTSAPMRKVQELQEAVSQQEKQLLGLTAEAKEVSTGPTRGGSQGIAHARQGRMCVCVCVCVLATLNFLHSSPPQCMHACCAVPCDFLLADQKS